MNPSLSDVKSYLGLTGTGDDGIIASSLASAIATAERDTNRVFSYASNRASLYSTDGQAIVAIRDVPLTDATRVVTLAGVALTENEGYWLLPDRRNPAVSVTIQLRHFDAWRRDWYKSDPYWWDKNLDRYGYGPGFPNDLRISSAEGHPELLGDVSQQMTFLAAWFYWRAKSGASGIVTTPTGEEIDLGAEPKSSPNFIANWMVKTWVASVG